MLTWHFGSANFSKNKTKKKPLRDTLQSFIEEILILITEFSRNYLFFSATLPPFPFHNTITAGMK